MPTPTMGGVQFWTDVVYLRGWRIQKHAWYSECRLLDPRDRRFAKGTLEECQSKLQEVAEQHELKPMTGNVVIVLHGLGRTRRSMKGLGRYLDKELDADVIVIGYASSRDRIEQHAEALASVIEHLPEVTQIDFVAHSMGNLVVRSYVQSQLDASGKIDDRLHRMVMIAPPNRGSKMARRLSWSHIFHLFSGISGRQLSTHWKDVETKLAVPPFEFGIIAGGVEGKVVQNPFINRPSDLIVTLDETKLEGASDFYVVKAAHTFIMDFKVTREAVARFLRDGHFRESGEKEPVADLEPLKH